MELYAALSSLATMTHSFIVAWWELDAPTGAVRSFPSYMEAEDFLVTLPAAKFCSYKFIECPLEGN